MTPDPIQSPAAEVPNEDATRNVLLSVRLSSWEWHHLLTSMESMMCIVNLDRTNVRLLYKAIASQLAGYDVSRREPEEPVAEPVERKPVEPKREEDSTPRASLWKRIFG